VPRIRLLVRAESDRIRFIVGHDAPWQMCAVGLLVAVVTMLPILAGVALSLATLAVGAAKLVHAVRGTRRSWSTHDFAVTTTPFPVADLPPPAAYPDAVYLLVPNRGTGLVCDAIDRVLIERDLTFTVAAGAYRLPPRLRATAPHVLARSNRHRVVFNGALVGLRGDPLPGTAELTLHHARFYDLMCSNEVCKFRITDRTTGAELDLRRELLADADGRLRTLRESKLSDPIGVSTVAITTDGVLLLVRQSRRNLASAGLLAPSGSGSLEPRDLNGASSLQHAVCQSMERELREETGLRTDQVVSTRVVGFARWMDRGAKPEFFGVTTLAGTADELQLTRPSGSEQLFSSEIHWVPTDLFALRQELERGTDLLEAPSLPRQVRDQGAFPLLLAVRAAALHA
jgi:8-oxo-dGTP pyrophosphatase MutT (NUDIX family)